MKKFFKSLVILILVIGIAAAGIWFIYPTAASFLTGFFSGGSASSDSYGYLFDMDGEGSSVSESELDSLEDSGITGDGLSFDTTYYPYYGFLDDTSKAVYAQVCANIEALSTTFVLVTNCTVDEACAAVDAVFMDHPEYFWLESTYSYKYTSEETCVQIIMVYSDLADDISSSKALFDSAADAIIDAAAALDTDYDREKYVHDEIISLASYNENSAYNQSAYSALVEGSTVCAGYSRAFQYVMTSLGIPAYYCTGYSGGDHAWNIVKLDDGYYNVDLTWDDSEPISYIYFNCTDANFASTHTRSDISSSLPACNATAYSGLENTGGPGAYPGSDGISLESSEEPDGSPEEEPGSGADTAPGADVPSSNTSDGSTPDGDLPKSDTSDGGAPESSMPENADNDGLPSDGETRSNAP